MRKYGKQCHLITIEKHVPTVEQRVVLEQVRDRVLTEFRLWKDGCDLPCSNEERLAQEKPLLGLIHGLPGTGKSKVILFIRRFFERGLLDGYTVSISSS